ncbi:YppG family protein [Heyndrickxia sporothermodurans]
MMGRNPYLFNQSLIRNYQPQANHYQSYFPYMQASHQPNMAYQNPYGNYHPPVMSAQPIPFGPAFYYQQQGNNYSGDDSQNSHIFHNPLQAVDNYQNNSQKHPNMQNQFSNPYPNGNHNIKPPQGGMSSLMNSFKSQDGSLDFNKMVNTAGQMMNAVNQVSSMVKGLGGLFKA